MLTSSVNLADQAENNSNLARGWIKERYYTLNPTRLITEHVLYQNSQQILQGKISRANKWLISLNN